MHIFIKLKNKKNYICDDMSIIFVHCIFLGVNICILINICHVTKIKKAKYLKDKKYHRYKNKELSYY